MQTLYVIISTMNKTETELREIIRQMCKDAGRAATAATLGIAPPYLSMIVRTDNPRCISQSIANKLGFVRETATTVLFISKNNSQIA